MVRSRDVVQAEGSARTEGARRATGVRADGAAKAIAVKGDELQQEIATGKNDLQQEIAAVKGDLKLLKFGYGPIRAYSTDQNRVLLIARGALTRRDAMAISGLEDAPRRPHTRPGQTLLSLSPHPPGRASWGRSAPAPVTATGRERPGRCFPQKPVITRSYQRSNHYIPNGRISVKPLH